MPVDVLLFIKPVNSSERTLNTIIDAVPKVGYAASRTIWDIAQSYGLNGEEYSLCVPLTRTRQGKDWSMPGIDEVYDYVNALQKKIPEIQQIEVRLIFAKAKYNKGQKAPAPDESLDELT
jgi:hypothetical protein